MDHVCRWITDLVLSALCQSRIIDCGVGEGRLADCCGIECRLPMPYQMHHLQGGDETFSVC